MVADIELDGREEILLWGTRSDVPYAAARFAVWRPDEGPRGRLEDGPFHGLAFPLEGRVGGLLAQDVDGDGDIDFVGWVDSEDAPSLFVLRNTGAEASCRVRIDLRGSPAAPSDARGVRVELFHEGTVRSVTPQGPRWTLGCGASPPYLLRARWPDGAIASVIDPVGDFVRLDHPGARR